MKFNKKILAALAVGTFLTFGGNFAMKAVDFLSNEKNVDADRIGILGICGWGGFALNAAAQDTRIKATVTSTMYDMSRNIANGYFDNDKDADTIQRERMDARKKNFCSTHD